MSVKTRIAGIEIPSYILNAAGVFDNTFDKLEWLMTENGYVAIHPVTFEARLMNSSSKNAAEVYSLVQNIDQPSISLIEVLDWLSMISNVDLVSKVSVSATDINEYLAFIQALEASAVSLIEIDVSKKIIQTDDLGNYDFSFCEELLIAMTDFIKKPFGLKIPQFGNIHVQSKMAELIEEYGVSFVTVMNGSEPASCKQKIDAQIFSTFLLEIKNYHNLFLNKNVSIVASGGISAASDVYSVLQVGADVFELGSILDAEGLNMLKQMKSSFADILRRKNLSVDRAKGEMMNIPNVIEL